MEEGGTLPLPSCSLPMAYDGPTQSPRAKGEEAKDAPGQASTRAQRLRTAEGKLRCPTCPLPGTNTYFTVKLRMEILKARVTLPSILRQVVCVMPPLQVLGGIL